MSPQYSTLETLSREAPDSGAAPAVPAPERTQVYQRGNQEPQQIDPLHRQTAIDHPRIDQRRQRQEEKAQDQKENAAERPVQIVREQEQQRQSEAGEREDHDQE